MPHSRNLLLVRWLHCRVIYLKSYLDKQRIINRLTISSEKWVIYAQYSHVRTHVYIPRFVFIKFPNQQAKGPFEVIEKHQNHFSIKKEDGSMDTVNRSNLYPTYLSSIQIPRQTRATTTELLNDLFDWSTCFILFYFISVLILFLWFEYFKPPFYFNILSSDSTSIF